MEKHSSNPPIHTLHQKAESLKALLSNNKNKNLNADGALWSALQDLQITCKQILLADLTYALEKKVDADLWNYGFKDYICYLQGLKEEMRAQKGVGSALKNGKMDARITLTWFLEMASGFYLMLLEELRTTYDLDYPFLGRTISFGFVEKPEVDDTRFTLSATADPVVHRNNCNYIVQHCLVHLGDLARYRNQITKAETYYRQAIQISPSSGQAYNQIALLEANRGKKLASVFYYVRSLAVKYPFPAASTNLMTILSRFLNNPPSKIINASTFTHSFLRLEASLRHSYKLKSAGVLRQECNDSLTSLIATESLQTWELLQIAAISLYQMETQESEEASLSKTENQIRQISCEFVASLLNSLLLPVYTTKQGGDLLLEYFGLPVVKILLEWILSHPNILKQKRFMMKKQIWPTFCTVLNHLNSIEDIAAEGSDGARDDCSLPEDYDLQGFLPLCKSSKDITDSKTLWDSCKSKKLNDRSLLLCRARKLIQIGKAFCAEDFPVARLHFGNDKFEVVDYEAQYDDEDNDALDDDDALDEPDDDDDSEAIEFVCDNERKESIGILKMNKPEDRLIDSSSSPKRVVHGGGRVNSVLKNLAERDNKQVTFRTPSPVHCDSQTESQSILFSFPPPAINVPPPNFPQSNTNGSPEGVGRQSTSPAFLSNPGDSSFFMAPNNYVSHPQAYNMRGTYSLFSGPNLLGLPGSSSEHQRPWGSTPPPPPFIQGTKTSDLLFRQGNKF